MVSLADTPVLVAAMVDGHGHHDRSLKWLQQVHSGKIEACVCAHSLAECFAVLTRLPIQPSISPALADRLIAENVESAFKLVDLSIRDYRLARQRLVTRKLRGGIIYDALIVQAALKKQVSQLVTWNRADFERLVKKSEINIVAP